MENENPTTEGTEEQEPQEQPERETHEDESSDLAETVERLQKELSRVRDEAAKNRIGKREATSEKQQLADRVAALEAEAHTAKVEAARANVMRAYNLPDNLGFTLGDDPDVMEDRAKALSEFTAQREPERKPFPADRASGGSAPRANAEPFNAAALASKFRGR